MTISKRKKALKKLEEAFNGVVLNSDEARKLSVTKNIESCGYLRKPLYDAEKEMFMGTCALQDFGNCDHPCSLPSWREDKYKGFSCHAYQQLMKYKPHWETDDWNHHDL